MIKVSFITDYDFEDGNSTGGDYFENNFKSYAL